MPAFHLNLQLLEELQLRGSCSRCHRSSLPKQDGLVEVKSKTMLVRAIKPNKTTFNQKVK